MVLQWLHLFWAPPVLYCLSRQGPSLSPYTATWSWGIPYNYMPLVTGASLLLHVQARCPVSEGEGAALHHEGPS